MLIAADSLSAHIERNGLARAYLIFGDEPLQATESADVIRAAARKHGCEERQRYEIDSGFNWSSLRAGANELSLFAQKRLIEVRLGARKPDKAASEIIAELLAQPDSEDSFLFLCDKLDRGAQKAKWFKVIDNLGVTVQVRQIKASQLLGWVKSRARERGMKMSGSAADFIVMRSEGNLLAAAQEIDKLALLIDREEVTAETIMNVMADSARYDVFGLIDVVLAGDAAKAIRMLRGLRDEGTEPVVIGWALNRELRSLAHMASAMGTGKPAAAVMQEHNVWSSRATIVRRALERASLKRMIAMFRDSIRLDRIIKGSLAGDPWNELELLCLELSGRKP